MMRETMKKLVFLVALTILATSLSGCINGIHNDPPVTPNQNTTKLEPDTKYINSTMEFSVKLFQNAYSSSENTLVSPLSILTALAMTTNGADNKTLEQMENILSKDIPITELNKYLHTYIDSLPSIEKAKFYLANSIWIKDTGSLEIKEDFLQKNVDYFNVNVYKEPFDNDTAKKINNWVKENTNNMIKEIIDEIDDATIMYLINALAFEAQWETPFLLNNINEDIFIDINGEKRNIQMMHSTEDIYLQNDKATGFIKPYADGKYSFVAILPNEDIDFNDYINQLDGEELSSLLKNQDDNGVLASLPKFSHEYSSSLKEILIDLGMEDAFDENDADFTKMANSTKGNIFIGDVIHKTFIQVDELGTKAGAATSVVVLEKSAKYANEIMLDRPFIYMIIDNQYNLPIFIGTVILFDNN